MRQQHSTSGDGPSGPEGASSVLDVPSVQVHGPSADSAVQNGVVHSERRRLDELISSMPGVVWEAYGAPDARSQQIHFVSGHVEQMLGYTVQDWIQTPNFWLTIVHPEDQQRAAAEAAAIFAAGASGVSRFRWVAKDGHILHVEARSVVILNEQGHPWGMRGVTLDISDRVAMEQELLKANERFTLAAEALNCLIFDWDITTGAVDRTQGLFEVLGFTPEEAEPTIHWWRMRIHPDDRRIFASPAVMLEQIRQHDYTLEYRIRHKDGRYVHVWERSRLVTDAAGQPVRLIGCTFDITARRRTEAELQKLNGELEQRVKRRTRELETANRQLELQMRQRQRSEETERIHLERLRTIIDSLPMGAVLMDEGMNISHVNRELCLLLNLQMEPEELVGRRGIELIGMLKEKTAQPLAYVNRVKAVVDQKKTALEQEIPLTDGRCLSRDYIPVIAEGRHRGHLMLYRDVTRQKRVDQAKSEFMSLASHQLRTPLTSVRWSVNRLERLLDDRLNVSEKHLLHEAHDSIVSMAGTINTMLTIARIEAAKVSPRNTSVHLPSLLQGMVIDCLQEPSVRAKTITADCEPDLLLTTDESLLKEIVRNLLENAVKYTPDGGRVTVTARAEGEHVRIKVQDTGCGIPAHQHGRVFEKFFRADNAILANTEGNGLGLYLVYIAVKLLQSDISFTSGESQGTTFSVLFPVQPHTYA